MKRIKLFLLSSFLLLTLIAKSQQRIFTIELSTADSLREVGDLNGAIQEYKKTYIADPNNFNNTYNFACALALTKQIDSCFKYLYKAIETDTSVNALTDPDFIFIKEDKKWSAFEDKLIAQLNIKFNTPYTNIDYAKKLWRMQAKDQAYYDEISSAEKKIGMYSTVVSALWTLKRIYNNENLTQLENLVIEKGWPKISEVGGRAAGAAFLIIQHSDSEKQKKYLPIIEKLCKEKEAS